MEFSNIKTKVSGSVLALSFTMLTACGGGGAGGGSADSEGTACAGGVTCGKLDEAQSLIGETVGGTVADALPAPLGPVVSCTSDAVNNVVDVPDALLLGVEGFAASQDPAVILAAFNDMGTSLGNAVFNLQELLTTLAGEPSGCDESGGTVSGLPSLSGIPSVDPENGLTGTPLDLALTPLADVLTIVVGMLDGVSDDPPGITTTPIVAGLNALLAILNGAGADQIPGLPPLTGVPLSPGSGENPLTTQLQHLLSQIDGLKIDSRNLPSQLPIIPGLIGLAPLPGGDGTDLNLVPLTDILVSITEIISESIAQGRAQLEGAAGSDVPVVGGALLTLETALVDVGVLLGEVGEYDNIGTNAALEALVENALDNALTQVLPLDLIGEQAGQDIAGPLRDGIAQGVDVVTDGTGVVLDIVFNNVLNGLATPVLNPVESLLSELLSASPIGVDDLLGGGIDQLVAALTDLTGGAGGNPLDALLGGLPALGGDLPAGDGPTGTPLDLLLGALVDNDPTGLLSGLLGQIAGPLSELLGLLGGLEDLAP